MRDEPGRIGLLTTREAAAAIGMSYTWMKRQASAGLVPHYRFGDRYFFSEDNITAILAAAEFRPGKPATPQRIAR